jgi:ATP-dependent DNA helicase RecG
MAHLWLKWLMKIESFDDNNQKLQDKLGENRQKILQLIKHNPDITIKELSLEVGISTTAIEKNIKLLKQKGYIKRSGGDKGGRWEILKSS